jgi:hypothetical protein
MLRDVKLVCSSTARPIERSRCYSAFRTDFSSREKTTGSLTVQSGTQLERPSLLLTEEVEVVIFANLPNDKVGV